MKLTFEQIAEACHEANRAYCHSLGDYSQLPWRMLSDERKSTTINGVEFCLANPDVSPAKTHENWLAHKKSLGYVYGPQRDDTKKTHPCMKPYSELPPEQRAKDLIFQSVVSTLKTF